MSHHLSCPWKPVGPAQETPAETDAPGSGSDRYEYVHYNLLEVLVVQLLLLRLSFAN